MNNNPYYQYPYVNQNQNYYQPQQQTKYHPFTFVSGIEGAKAFIVNPNQTVYLKDSDSDILYKKSANQDGVYSMIAYEMKLINTEPKQESFVTQKQLIDFENVFYEKLNNLSKEIEKALKKESVKDE